MEKAIKKAIEGGWGGGLKTDVIIELFDETKTVGFHYPGKFDGVEMSIYDLLLQSLFWQALGKAEGWKKSRVPFYTDNVYIEAGWHDISTWQYQWHHFIDHLIAGKDINSFFEELLK